MYSSAYVWAKVLGHMEERLGAVTVSAWFDDAEVVELNEDNLILYSPSDFRREIIRRRCTDYIHDALKEIFNSDAKLLVFGDEELNARKQKGKSPTSMDFNPQFTFDNFVVGPSNRFAHSAAIAVSKTPGQVYNPLFIYGPPGVGKTSIVRGIARAMGRKFVQMSLGGVRDEAEIRGHRRTYIGAMPGRIIEAISRSGSMNPLLLLDEIDKMGDSIEHGDPESVLLDILDSDRSRFVDNYLGLPLDLSNVIFVATANSTKTLSPILQDRLDVVELPPYKPSDKKKIVEKYLWPRLITEYRLDCLDYLCDPLEENFEHPGSLRLEEDAVEELIKRCPEERVRDLERICRRICESVISMYYADGTLIESVDFKNLEILLKPIYYK